MLKLFIDKVDNIDGDDKHGTPLLTATFNGNDSISKILIDKGANINATTYDGRTVLMNALFPGKLKIDTIKKLIEGTTDVNTRNSDGQTALHTVFEDGDTKKIKSIIKFLIDKGADVNIKDSWGKTPLSLATENGYTDIANLLKQSTNK